MNIFPATISQFPNRAIAENIIAAIALEELRNPTGKKEPRLKMPPWISAITLDPSEYAEIDPIVAAHAMGKLPETSK